MRQEIGPLQKQMLLTLYRLSLKSDKSGNVLHVNELARILKKSPVTVSISLKQLVEKKYVSTNEASRGKVKALRLEPKGLFALFAYCRVDPVEFYSKRSEKLPLVVDRINKIFIDSKIKSQTFRNVYSSFLSDQWTVEQDGKVQDRLFAGFHLTVLITLAEIAKQLLKEGEGLVNKQEYFKFLEVLENEIVEYVRSVKTELS